MDLRARKDRTSNNREDFLKSHSNKRACVCLSHKKLHARKFLSQRSGLCNWESKIISWKNGESSYLKVVPYSDKEKKLRIYELLRFFVPLYLYNRRRKKSFSRDTSSLMKVQNIFKTPPSLFHSTKHLILTAEIFFSPDRNTSAYVIFSLFFQLQEIYSERTKNATSSVVGGLLVDAARVDAVAGPLEDEGDRRRRGQQEREDKERRY